MFVLGLLGLSLSLSAQSGTRRGSRDGESARATTQVVRTTTTTTTPARRSGRFTERAATQVRRSTAAPRSESRSESRRSQSQNSQSRRGASQSSRSSEVRGRTARGPDRRSARPIHSHQHRGHGHRGHSHSGYFRTVRERVYVPGYHEWVDCPAEYGFRYDSCGVRIRFVVRPACRERVWVPGRWEYQNRRVWVPAHRHGHRH